MLGIHYGMLDKSTGNFPSQLLGSSAIESNIQNQGIIRR